MVQKLNWPEWPPPWRLMGGNVDNRYFEDETKARIAQVQQGGRLEALVDGLWRPVLPRKGQNVEAENN